MTSDLDRQAAFLDNRRIRTLINIGTAMLVAVAVMVILQTRTVVASDYVCLTTYIYDPECPAGIASPLSARTTPSPAAPMTITEDLRLDGEQTGGIVIAADGITLDCAGNSVIGRKGTGIEIIGRSNVTITDCYVAGFDIGVRLTNAANATITEVTAAHNNVGFELQDSASNTLKNNVANLNSWGFELSGSDSNLLRANRTTRGYVGIRIANGEDNRLVGNEIADPFDTGIFLENATSNELEGNTLAHSRDSGIHIDGEHHVVTKNVVDAAGDAFTVEGVHHTLAENVIDSWCLPERSLQCVPDNAITVAGSGHTISENQINAAEVGMFLIDVVDSTFSDNSIHFAIRASFQISETSRGNAFIGNEASRDAAGVKGTLVMLGNTWTDNSGLGLPTARVIDTDLTLTNDQLGPIVISADGITLDCAGHEIVAPETGRLGDQVFGIEVTGRRDVTITNCRLGGYQTGISLWRSTGITIRDNTANIWAVESNGNSIVDNDYTGGGPPDQRARFLTLKQSTGNVVTGNEATRGRIELDRTDSTTISGNRLTTSVKLIESTNTTITNNMTRGIYLQRSHDNTISANSAAFMRVAGSDRNVIAGNAISGDSAALASSSGAIRISGSDQNTVSENTIAAHGMSAERSTGNTFEANQIAGGPLALLRRSTGNTITANTVSGAEIGFYLDESHDNTLKGNIATDNQVGFRIRRAHGNTLEGNDATANLKALSITRKNKETFDNTFTDNIGM